ncbi:MAG: hypothetical protein LBG46_00210 [Elusimicrobiota bacterium]|jgi:iron only hydrogenase large subunit-like protein|nr:hypothetical protein [Elusimicrobiota bacterium]
MNEGQAQVLNQSCIVCGECLRHCPQGAKQYADSIVKVESLLRGKHIKTIATVAPSFVSNLDAWQQKRFASALRLLGFDYIFETAIGAYYTALESYKYIKDEQNVYIHSSCPAAVNYIAKYKPELADKIAPVVSPMIGHARILRQIYDARANIVFIGPCVAKKDEILWDNYKDLINAALTFEEIFKMFKAHNIDLKKCDESSFDKPSFYKSQYYPLPGGILKTLNIDETALPKRLLCVDGPENVKNALDNFGEYSCDIEIMWCDGGCTNGPLNTESSIIKKRVGIIDYAAENKNSYPKEKPDPVEINLYNKFSPRPIASEKYSQSAIENTLKLMDKENEEDRLNCGGCGYPSCREKAIAILNGYAQKEMCMPYLRRHLNMQNTNIIDSMPCGIVILDGELNIAQTNAFFNQMFRCDGSVMGRHISLIMDPHPFEKIISGENKNIDLLTEFKQYDIKCRFIVYNMRSTQQLAGIFLPVMSAEELSKIKSSLKMRAIDKAKELLKHQIDTNQKIAKYLGESTAQSQIIVNQIMQIASDDEYDES